jgi:hypothetical protein
MEIVGTIKGAVFVNNTWEPRSPCIHGLVYGDTKGRFHDGEAITTSKIEDIFAADDGAVIVKTRFSVYRVEFAPQP